MIPIVFQQNNKERHLLAGEFTNAFMTLIINYLVGSSNILEIILLWLHIILKINLFYMCL